ncbi:probable E3 ubiquitin-protein ligase HERC6 [Haplochromis burtoni]|uniref:probable E3 ubiquitin-protein ligase HERC6 n=1 Tax=Haplochromis burtoni TaxID=8153 RepID=UPI001C2CE10E|nr:probable E3 ubiquitin-protein ligase HERC6 [Haplochromis burtoni]
MDLQSKKTVFDMNSECTQRQHQMGFGLPDKLNPQSNPIFFELRLQRASLFEGTFRELEAAPHNACKKPLVVYFDEDPNTKDVYKRDLFHHLFLKMVSEESGMFMLNDSKTLAWFPSNATEESKRNFFLFGLLCGLALYNQCIIHLPFPLVLFKKLLSLEPTLEDMMEFSPTVGRTLQTILNYEDDVLDNLYMDFWINWDGIDVDLDPQTPGKPLTSQNKKEFVEAYVNHAFNTSVESVFQEFKRGFFLVCEQDLVRLFRPEELQGVLVGQDVHDWEKFKQNTVYELEHVRHSTIKMFWEVFDELTEEQRKDFLRFLTGYRRAPILGMDQVHMKVRVKQIQSSTCDQHFPEALTCHSILNLPFYSTKEILRDRLTEALLADTEFTL